MTTAKEKNCRLCLNMLDDDYIAIEEYTIQIFEVLLLNVDLAISEGPVVCKSCMESVQDAFNFKSTCISVNKQVVFLAAHRNSAELDIRDVYLNENESKSLAFNEDYVCRFCLQCLEQFNLSNDLRNQLIEDMLLRCIPELDLNIIKEPMICVACLKSLEDYYSFIRKCQNTEETIAEYYKVQGLKCNGQINLNNILKSIVKGKLEPIGNCDSNVLLKEDNLFQNEGDTYFDIHKVVLKTEGEELIIKDENQYLDCETEYKSVEIKGNEVVSYDVLTNKNFTQHSYKDNTKVPIHISLHNYEAKQQCSIRLHNDSLDIVMYRCEKCTFETKYKYSLKSHMLIHKDKSEVIMYKCNLCNYETKWRGSLIKHRISHKSSSDVIMYKCERCTFETKYKKNLKAHGFIHKTKAEMTTYKGNLCSYEAKQSCSIRLDNNSLDIVMYGCEKCTYQTKYKKYLNRHMLIHKDKSEVIMYKCNWCSYETKRRGSLIKHMLTHKSSLDVVMYKCERCTFETKYKKSLKAHKFIHKTEAEMTTYKGNLCSYEAKQKCSIRSNNDSSDTVMYRCANCTYETKQRRYFKSHLLIHKDNSEVIMRQCKFCSYETKWRSSLRKHMLIHKDSSDVVMYKCEKCTFETKYKESLKAHMLFHKTKAEMTTYKCTLCSFEAIRKDYLRRHMLHHEHSSEIVTASLN